MTINGFVKFLNKHFLVISIMLIIAFFYTYFKNDKEFRESIFYLIETNIFYREIPPVYNNYNFKTMEPNKVCDMLSNVSVVGSSYSRSKYFEFACESNTLVSSDSSWSIQYIVTGKLFNVDNIVLKMEFLKKEKKYDSVKEMINFVDSLFLALGYDKVPDNLKHSIINLNNDTIVLKNETKVKLIDSDESVTLIFY